jgi:hypothetical protein
MATHTPMYVSAVAKTISGITTLTKIMRHLTVLHNKLQLWKANKYIMIETDLQIFFAYIVGTAVGFVLCRSFTISNIIDRLCADGFLRNYVNKEGDKVIVKWNDSTKEH